ncbi:response regulator [Azospirillum cavernae]|uniref:Response regulator n=1 Tax=Azospirillum cavernae TaxID=2320860 RepID=A0A418VZJ8_9PROT|nr:response regulator [Azospirillum cavernae]RJF83181.1 response regulator [Azospirillum cavernae]
MFSIDADIHAPDTGGRRALVADDDPAQRDALTRHLTQRGYRVSQARDGMDALTIIGTEAPRFALLQRAPNDDSGERAAALAAMLYPHTQIIVTANADAPNDGALEDGPFPVLRRPINLDQLDRCLDALAV